jgi:hypothetical protein
MAIDKEDDIAKLAESLGGVIAPASMIDDPKSMLKAIQNAALIRAGVGMLGQRRVGESGYDVASRVIGDVAKSSAEQIKSYAAIAAATGKKTIAAEKEKRSVAKDALSAYSKLYYTQDPVTGAIKMKRTDFQTAGIDAPNQELFKNELYPLFLDSENALEKLHKTHIKLVGLNEGWRWEDTINTYKDWVKSSEEEE